MSQSPTNMTATAFSTRRALPRCAAKCARRPVAHRGEPLALELVASARQRGRPTRRDELASCAAPWLADDVVHALCARADLLEVRSEVLWPVMVASFLAALEDRHDILGSFGVLALTQRALGGSTVLLRDGVLFGGLRGLQAHVLYAVPVRRGRCARRCAARSSRRPSPRHWSGAALAAASSRSASRAASRAMRSASLRPACQREWLGSLVPALAPQIRPPAASATVCAACCCRCRPPHRAGAPPERVQTDCRRSGRANARSWPPRRRNAPPAVTPRPRRCAAAWLRASVRFPRRSRVRSAILVVQERARRRLGRLLPPDPEPAPAAATAACTPAHSDTPLAPAPRLGPRRRTIAPAAPQPAGRAAGGGARRRAAVAPMEGRDDPPAHPSPSSPRRPLPAPSPTRPCGRCSAPVVRAARRRRLNQTLNTRAKIPQPNPESLHAFKFITNPNPPCPSVQTHIKIRLGCPTRWRDATVPSTRLFFLYSSARACVTN